MKIFTLIALLCSLLSFGAFAQETVEKSEPEVVTKELTRKERRKLKKQFRKLSKEILKSPELSYKFFDIINNCDATANPDCLKDLEDAVQDTSNAGVLNAKANGMTFGICKTASDAKGLHKLVVSKKQYECKLSSHGKVYEKKVDRKMYGPGLWWDRQSIVLMCTGPAYGLKMTGLATGFGAYYGITLTTLVGKAGLCLVVGAGKSAGVYIGADRYIFEEL